MVNDRHIQTPVFTSKNVCSFTGKERDAETGYSYFGARYYDSDLSGLFLSVDPMADKYPSISPYAYCAWNPVRLLDSNGDSVTVSGEQSLDIVNQLQTDNLNITINDNGYLNVDLRKSDLSDLSREEKVIYDAIVSDKINIHITTGVTPIDDNGSHFFNYKRGNETKKMLTLFGGSFCGAYRNMESGKVDTYTFIDFDYMNGLGYDQGVPHEISESYYAGLFVLTGGIDIPYADINRINNKLMVSHQYAIPERLENGRTYMFGPMKGLLKFGRMKTLNEINR